MTMIPGPVRPWVRILNAAFAVARADSQYQGEWIDYHAKHIAGTALNEARP